MGEQKWADACTRNCVWLFQRAEYSFASEVSQGYEFNHEEEKWVREDDPDGSVDIQEMIDAGFAFKHWHTSAVFLTRVEGVDYGFRRHYDHGKYGEDWRLYGVPAHGEMVRFLDKGGVSQSYIDTMSKLADRSVQAWQVQLAKK